MKETEFEVHMSNLKLDIPECLNLKFNDMTLNKHKPFGVSKAYPYMPVLKEPIEVYSLTDKHAYRVVPLHPNLMVNRIGTVRYVCNSEILSTAILGNYKRVYIKKDGAAMTIAVHRLVAMAWVPNDDYITKNIVDHIDGNKLNNVANNLRWTSASLNNARVRNIVDRRWWVKKIGSDIIHRFISLTEVGKFFNRDKTAYSSNRTPFVVKVSTGSYIVEDVMNFKGWSLETSYDAFGNKILYIIDGNGHSSVNEVIAAYGLDKKLSPYRDKVLEMLRHDGRKVKTTYTETKNTGCIKVTELSTGKELRFNKRSDGYKAIGVSKNAFNERLSGKRGGEPINGYMINWCDDVVEVVKSNDRSTQVVIRRDDEEHTFSSLRKASEFLNVDRKTLVSKEEIDGYRITIK